MKYSVKELLICFVIFWIACNVLFFLDLFKERKGLRYQNLETVDMPKIGKKFLVLSKILRERYLDPPSLESYNLMMDEKTKLAEEYNKYLTKFPNFLRTRDILQRLFRNFRDGFFIESGAMDGEFISNSLYLEKELGWTGMLIEPDTKTYQHLRLKNRKSWSSNTCISSGDYMSNVSFVVYSGRSTNILEEMLIRSTSNVDGVASPGAGVTGNREILRNVSCFPLYTYLLALNKTSVDYISLDVEGSETDILLTFPWNKVNVTVWTIEHRLLTDKFRNFMGMKKLGQKGRIDILSQVHRRNKSPKFFNKDDQKNIKYTIESNSTFETVIKHETRFIYTHNTDPTKGKDQFFVEYMEENGYTILDYWDGDYTFVRSDSVLRNIKLNELIS